MDMLELINVMGSQNDPAMMMNIGAFLFGLILHVLKKCYREKVSVQEYIFGHKLNTCISLSSLVSVFMLLNTMYSGSPLIVYAMGGYCVDSLMNKTPLSNKRVLEDK